MTGAHPARLERRGRQPSRPPRAIADPGVEAPSNGFSAAARVAVVLAALAALAVLGGAAPFVLTAPAARLALRQALPANRPTLGGASLSATGTLRLRAVALDDAGAFAGRRLITAEETEIDFSWRELLARRLRRVRVDGVTLHVRADGTSWPSLIDLLPSAAGPSAGPASPASDPSQRAPLWIDEVDVRGHVRSELSTGGSTAPVAWPLRLRATMSGGRARPSRDLRLEIGAEDRRPGSRADPAAGTIANAGSAGTGFGVRADLGVHPRPEGTRISVRVLDVHDAALGFEAAWLRAYWGWLPTILDGHIDARLTRLSATGFLDRGTSPGLREVAGEVRFDGLAASAMDAPGISVALEAASGRLTMERRMRTTPATVLRLEPLAVRHVEATIDLDRLRPGLGAVLAGENGRFVSSLGSLDLSGRVILEPPGPARFEGGVQLRDLTLRSSAGKPAFALAGLSASGHVASPVDGWDPGALSVRDGSMRFARLSYRENELHDLDAAWRVDAGRLHVEPFSVGAFDGRLRGRLAFDLVSRAVVECVVSIEHLDVERVLANLSPGKLDAEGRASGAVRLVRDAAGEISGRIDLAFDEPGILKIGSLEPVRDLLVANFGVDLAELAMRDLAHFPFRSGRVSLESQGTDSSAELHFVRMPRDEDIDPGPPHRAVIRGQAVSVRSVVASTIDLEIPIRGQSLARIVATASGMMPAHQVMRGTAGPQRTRRVTPLPSKEDSR